MYNILYIRLDHTILDLQPCCKPTNTCAFKSSDGACNFKFVKKVIIGLHLTYVADFIIGPMEKPGLAGIFVDLWFY